MHALPGQVTLTYNYNSSLTHTEPAPGKPLPTPDNNTESHQVNTSEGVPDQQGLWRNDCLIYENYYLCNLFWLDIFREDNVRTTSKALLYKLATGGKYNFGTCKGMGSTMQYCRPTDAVSIRVNEMREV